MGPLKLLCFLAGFAVAATPAARADPATENHIFANAALHHLHNLARAAAEYSQSTKQSDQIGCRDAYSTIQKEAHRALVDMDSMSFSPSDAVSDVSGLLRLSQLTPSQCSNGMFAGVMFASASNAIVALRYDYAIGFRDWYTVTKMGAVQGKNPLQYARSLRDQGYSWVSVLPKGMFFMGETDWKAEIASSEVDDPSIQDSGRNLKAVEVDYRESAGDSATEVYFYRTAADAIAADKALKQQAAEEKQQAAEDAKAAAELKASISAWNEKLMALPFTIPDNKKGFKLVYSVCKETGKTDADGLSTCDESSSHDWSDGSDAPYRWFEDPHDCQNALEEINAKQFSGKKHLLGVTLESNDVLFSACVPASKPASNSVKGYELVLALDAPGADDDRASYAELRKSGTDNVRVFRAFNGCNTAKKLVFRKLARGLGVDSDGDVIGKKGESIEVTATCARVY